MQSRQPIQPSSPSLLHSGLPPPDITGRQLNTQEFTEIHKVLHFTFVCFNKSTLNKSYGICTQKQRESFTIAS